MQSDHFGHGTGNAVAKMTLHRVADHGAYFFQSVALSEDGVPQRGGGIASINFVFAHFKDDLSRESSLIDELYSGNAGSSF